MKYLSFLDNIHVNMSIIIILILYNSQLFVNINKTIGNLYQYSFIKFIVLLLIACVDHKDTNIAILLGISYVISLNSTSNENFQDIDYNKSFKIASTVKKNLAFNKKNHYSPFNPKYKRLNNNDKKILKAYLFRNSENTDPKIDKVVMIAINNLKNNKKYITNADLLVARGVHISNYSHTKDYARNKFLDNI